MAETLAALMKKSGEAQFEVVEGVENVSASGDTTFTITSAQNKSPMYVYVATQGATYDSFTDWSSCQFDDTIMVMARERKTAGYDGYVAAIGTLWNGASIASISNNSVVLKHHASGSYTGTSIKYKVVFK